MDAKSIDFGKDLLAWQGLQIPIREDWRPLQISGKYEQGSVMVGNMDGPIFQLRWLRPPKDYDARGWIDARCRQAAAGQKSPQPPSSKHFDQVSWIKDLEIREEAKKTVWWGCAKNGEVLVELLLTNLAAPIDVQWFWEYALPKLKVIPRRKSCRWQIYSARFQVPPGFVLKRHRLAAGDIALEFRRNRFERLLLRQVYPGRLALERRPMRGWLRDRAFSEHRRFRKQEETGRDGESIKWKGWKGLPFPLGWIMPIHSESVIAQDTELDRLLIVEADWRDYDGAVLKVDELTDAMRWRSS